MKRLRDFFISICLVVLNSLTASAQAPAANNTAQPAATDSIAISLLTCSPGNEVWSLYGHTAIRFQIPSQGVDLAINYGMFNFSQKNFVLRFVFGLTDYEMGIVSFGLFLSEYAHQGRGVTEQHLNLSEKEKKAIAAALSRNYEPENRVYRYNYFYDNCTTRARDILLDNLDGKVVYAANKNTSPSYRQMIHQWNDAHRWARMGNDLLLGIKADAPTNRAQQQFLPDTLRSDFSHAIVVTAQGERHPLVDTTFAVLQPYSDESSTNTDVWDALSPRIVFGIFAVALLIVALFEAKHKKTLWAIDAILLTADGLAGLVLLAMVFSQHPTVNANLQILLLNPLSILFVYPAVRQRVKHLCHWYWKAYLACLVLFLIGNFFQDYAEGMNILALTLMMRCWTNIKTLSPKGK